MRNPSKRGFAIQCRECGEERELPTVANVVAWYMIHTVKTHWETVEQLRAADDKTIAAAIGLGIAKRWLE
jgi:hypothetical protein